LTTDAALAEGCVVNASLAGEPYEGSVDRVRLSALVGDVVLASWHTTCSLKAKATPDSRSVAVHPVAVGEVGAHPGTALTPTSAIDPSVLAKVTPHDTSTQSFSVADAQLSISDDVFAAGFCARPVNEGVSAGTAVTTAAAVATTGLFSDTSVHTRWTLNR
jgi:hypothetical protein